MGFLDGLLKKGAKMIDDAIGEGSHAVTDLANQAISQMDGVLGNSQHTAAGESAAPQTAGNRSASAGRQAKKSFDQKLREFVARSGEYELGGRLTVQELEQEFGKEIYTRATGRCAPENITYTIYQGQERRLLIRLWENSNVYQHAANREIRRFCEENGVKLLDFFDYMPNEEEYMSERLTQALG